MKNSIDNLNALLRQFVEDASADSMADDIRRGDDLLDRYPAPALSPKARARIRFRLETAQAGRRRTAMFGWATAVAAAVAVIVFLLGGTESFPPAQPESSSVARVIQSPISASAPMPAPAASGALPGAMAALWDDSWRLEIDASLAALKTEMDTIAAMIEAVSFKKRDASQDCFSTNQENERADNFINITDFWQG